MARNPADAALLRPVTEYRTAEERYKLKNVPWMSAPAVARTPGGRLWLTFNTGPDDPISNVLSLSCSDDDGLTWQECVWCVHTENRVRLHEPLVWASPDGRIRISWIQTYITWDGRGGLWVSEILGPDGDAPCLSEPHRVCDGVMANDPVFLPDGSALLCVSRWNWDGEYYNVPEDRCTMLYRTADDFRSAQCLARSDVPRRTFDEASLAFLSDGRAMMIVRTEYGWGRVVSSGCGSGFGPAEVFRTGPSAKSVLRTLPSGRLLWVGYDTSRTVRERICAFLSEDGGGTWPYKLLLDGRESVSYPNTHVCEDGTIYVTHDFERTGAKEIVLHRITENDILAGKAVTEGSFLFRKVRFP